MPSKYSRITNHHYHWMKSLSVNYCCLRKEHWSNPLSPGNTLLKITVTVLIEQCKMQIVFKLEVVLCRYCLCVCRGGGVCVCVLFLFCCLFVFYFLFYFIFVCFYFFILFLFLSFYLIYLFFWLSVSRERVMNSAVVGMIFPYRHVGIIWSRRRHACRHNSSFKIEWNTRRKTVKTKVSRIIHAYIISLP